MKPIRTAIGIVLAIMLTWAGTGVPRGAAPEFPDEARSAMFGFLNAWLVQQDQTSVMAHFSASGDALTVAPRAVLKAPGDGRGVSPWTPRERKAPGKPHDGLSHQQQDAYWQVLNRLGVSYGEGPLEEVLAPIDPDLSAAPSFPSGAPTPMEFGVFMRWAGRPKGKSGATGAGRLPPQPKATGAPRPRRRPRVAATRSGRRGRQGTAPERRGKRFRASMRK